MAAFVALFSLVGGSVTHAFPIRPKPLELCAVLLGSEVPGLRVWGQILFRAQTWQDSSEERSAKRIAIEFMHAVGRAYRAVNAHKTEFSGVTSDDLLFDKRTEAELRAEELALNPAFSRFQFFGPDALELFSPSALRKHLVYEFIQITNRELVKLDRRTQEELLNAISFNDTFDSPLRGTSLGQPVLRFLRERNELSHLESNISEWAEERLKSPEFLPSLNPATKSQAVPVQARGR